VKIDLAVAVFIGFFALLGLFSGAIKQIGHLGGVALGYLASRPVAALALPLVVGRLGYPPLLANVACSFLAFFSLYLAGSFVVRFVLRRVFPAGESGAANRLGGLLFAGAKTALILTVILSAVVFLEKRLASHWGDFQKEASASVAMAFVRKHNVFAGLPFLRGLATLQQASRDPDAAARLAKNPEFVALSKDPRLKALLGDASVARAFEQGDVAAMLSSAKVLNVVNDPKLAERLGKLAAGAGTQP
jgi:membrane protein required for colicin V production